MKEILGSQVGPLALPDTYARITADAETNAVSTRSVWTSPQWLADAIDLDWDGAEVWKTGLSVVTEVPAVLKTPVDYTVLVEKSGLRVSLTTQRPIVRLVMTEPLAGNAIECVLATFLPDERWDGAAEELRMTRSTAGYSGLVIYSLPDGTPLCGWRYDDGAPGHALLFDEDYADLRDPDIRIGVGFSAGAATRNPNLQRFSMGIEDGSGGGGGGKDNIFIKEMFGVKINPYNGGIGSSYGSPNGIDGVYVNGNRGNPHDRYYDNGRYNNFHDGLTHDSYGSPGGGYTLRERGGGSPQAKPSPNADGIFNTSKLSEKDRKKLEGMVNLLLIDCMGGSLYNALKGEKFNFIYDPNAVHSTYNNGNKTITLRDLSNYGTLTQELFHAYQFRELGGRIPSSLESNIEVEAHLAEYLLLERTPPNPYQNAKEIYSNSKSEFNRRIVDLSMLLDRNCKIPSSRQSSFDDLFSDTVKAYSREATGNPPFSLDKKDLNIDKLEQLSKNC